MQAKAQTIAEAAIPPQDVLHEVWGLFVFRSLNDPAPLSPAAEAVRTQVAAALYPGLTIGQALTASQASYQEALQWVKVL